MHIRLFLAVGLLLNCSWPARAQEPTVVELQLTPQPVTPESAALHMLPRAPELKDGNAAVVMLRSIWERQGFWHHEWPKLDELIELPYDDPRIVEEFSFAGMQPILRQAAYIRDADWNYPMDEEPLGQILLPDAQGLRDIAGRGLSLWIGQRIAKDELEQAREGILVQLACSRHIARTPLMIIHLVSYAIADLSLDKLGLLLQQRQCPNLYWALAKLPSSLGDTQVMLQWEAEILPRSLPSLLAKPRAIGDPAWKQIAQEFSDFMLMSMDEPLTRGEAEQLRQRLLTIAHEGISHRFDNKQLAEMSDEEVVMRWILRTHERIYQDIIAAHALPPHRALTKLQEVRETVRRLLEETGAPTSPFPKNPVAHYVGLHRFDRRVKLLQTVEAIRDHAARNDGKLPEMLDDVSLHVPNDPLTGTPFQYTLDGDQATLAMPVIEGVDRSIQTRRVYEIRLLQ